MTPTSEWQRDPESDGPDHEPDAVLDDFEPAGGDDED